MGIENALKTLVHVGKILEQLASMDTYEVVEVIDASSGIESTIQVFNISNLKEQVAGPELMAGTKTSLSRSLNQFNPTNRR